MTLSELGVILQTEREKRGLTLNDVADRLRISIHVLRALEMADMDALPHKAYTKGFIRSYASLLGFTGEDIEACVASFSEGGPSVAQPIVVQPVAVVNEAGAYLVPVGKMLACALVLLLLGGGGYAAWHFRLLDMVPSVDQLKTTISHFTDAGKTPEDMARTPETAPQPVAKHQGRVAETNSKPEVGQPTSGQVVASQHASEHPGPNKPAPDQTDSGPSATGQPGSAHAVSVMPAQEPAASMPRHHKIIVTATEDCWIQSIADKTNTRQFTLRKGDTFALTFAKNLEVKLGNAAGVRIRHNGKELPPAGKRGETRTLTFPPVTQQ